MAPGIYISDDVIRHASIERKIVKHCIEVLWISGTKAGGVGFGFNTSYLRFTESLRPGYKNVTIIDLPKLYIPMADSKRAMICLDTTVPQHVFTVIKNNQKRETKFQFPSPSKPIRVTFYNGDGNEGTSQFNLFTHKYEFEHQMPSQYKAWGDDIVITCIRQNRILFNKITLFIALLL